MRRLWGSSLASAGSAVVAAGAIGDGRAGQSRNISSSQSLRSPKNKQTKMSAEKKTSTAETRVSIPKVSPPRLRVPSRQSHLRLEDTSENSVRAQHENEEGEALDHSHIQSSEQAIKHNAFNLVMKLLYGKISDSSVLEGTHRILGTPSGKVCQKLGLSPQQKKISLREQQNRAALSSFTIEEAGAFAKAFIEQQKEIWSAYDTAVAKARWEECAQTRNGRRGATGGGLSDKVEKESSGVEALLAGAFPRPTSAMSSFYQNSTTAKDNSKRRFSPPSDLIGRLYAKRAARYAQNTYGSTDASSLKLLKLDGKIDMDRPEIRSALAKEKLLSLYTPAPVHGHGIEGCFVRDYCSFSDMLTNHGMFYTEGPNAAEDLYVASQLASTQSKTLSSPRLAAMRSQYCHDLPAARYLFSPPGMLVRGYTASRAHDESRVLVLEPTDRWLARCREDVLNFERFCLAKVSANSLRNLTTRITAMSRENTASSSILSSITNEKKGVDCIRIMDLFLMFRGMPTGATPRQGPLSALALARPQQVANDVTAHYIKALAIPLETLPNVDSLRKELGEALTVRSATDVDKVINEHPEKSLIHAIGLTNRAKEKSNGGKAKENEKIKDEEASNILDAYRQQAMFLRRHSSSYSPSLHPRTSSEDVRLSGVAGTTDGTSFAEEEMAAVAAANAARFEGLHAYDALARVVSKRKS